MGDAADDALEYEMSRHMIGVPKKRPRTLQSGAGNFMWRTSTGVISMWNMDEQHLRNAINMCETTHPNPGKAKQLRHVLFHKFKVQQKPKTKLAGLEADKCDQLFKKLSR